jgi:hypothetical protein
MESGEVLRVSNVLWVPKLRRSFLSVSDIEKKGYHILFRDGQLFFVPRRSSFKLAVFIGVREGTLYRLRGQPIQAVTSYSRETNEEQVAPPVVRQVAPPTTQVQREKIAPPMVQAQKEPDFRGSKPLGSSREEQPPKTVQRKLDFRGSQQTQREHHSSRGSLP